MGAAVKARRTGGKPVTAKYMWVCPVCCQATTSHWSIIGSPRWSCSECFMKGLSDECRQS